MWKLHRVDQGLLHSIGCAHHERCFENARRYGADADSNARQVSGDWQRHSHDAALTRTIGRLSDLPIERRHRGGVYDHAPLFIRAYGRVSGHRGGAQPQAVESANEIDVHNKGEVLEGHGAVSSDGANG